jgi:hypothetical protein
MLGKHVGTITTNGLGKWDKCGNGMSAEVRKYKSNVIKSVVKLLDKLTTDVRFKQN